MDPNEEQFDIIDTPDDDGDDFDAKNEDGHHAPITLRATSTSNPKRPRTLRAGYEYSTGTLTVIFRDGTWWNYYKVPPAMWDGFRTATSKGAYLESSGLNNWPEMGKPSSYSVSSAMQRALSRTRDIQVGSGGKQFRKIYGVRGQAAYRRGKGLGQP